MVLFIQPQWRLYFRPASAPDAVLLAFVLPDLVFVVGAALGAAWNFMQHPKAALLPLSLHTGGVVYATLFCIAQWAFSGEAVAGAIFMTPCAVISSVILGKLCREK